MSPSNLITLLSDAKLSPEELGRMSGVSGMTIRRWIEKPSRKQLPPLYDNAIRDAVFKLVIEGRLDSESYIARQVFSRSGRLAQDAAIKALGFPSGMTGNFENQQDEVVSGLAKVGSLESRRQKVELSKGRLPAYKRMGKQWSERITTLTKIISSKKLAALDKFPAYGALFYLIMTFDLIPDTIPVFGLMDDFTILGIAVAYYARRKVSG